MTKLMPGADVWFHAGAHELQLLSDQPLAAKVTYVHHTELVNLIVWGRGGESFQRASVHFWDREEDAPETNYATWIDEGDWKVVEAPATADVTRHPFEGRPSGGMEDLDRAREARSALDAKSNMDHGAPRGAPSPFSGGPLSAEELKTYDAKAENERIARAHGMTLSDLPPVPAAPDGGPQPQALELRPVAQQSAGRT